MPQKKKPIRWIYLIPAILFLVTSVYALYSFPRTSEDVSIVSGETVFVPDGSQIVLAKYRTVIVLSPNQNTVSQSVWLYVYIHVKDVKVSSELQSFSFQQFWRLKGFDLEMKRVNGGVEINVPSEYKIW